MHVDSEAELRKEIEMLYEIISPDAFLRPYIDDYTGLASMYAVVAKAYTKQVYVDRAFQRKTNELVQKHVTSSPIAANCWVENSR